MYSILSIALAVLAKAKASIRWKMSLPRCRPLGTYLSSKSSAPKSLGNPYCDYCPSCVPCGSQSLAGHFSAASSRLYWYHSSTFEACALRAGVVWSSGHLHLPFSDIIHCLEQLRRLAERRILRRRRCSSGGESTIWCRSFRLSWCVVPLIRSESLYILCLPYSVAQDQDWASWLHPWESSSMPIFGSLMSALTASSRSLPASSPGLVRIGSCWEAILASMRKRLFVRSYLRRYSFWVWYLWYVRGQSLSAFI